MKRKRLVRGKDWHGWVWKPSGEEFRYTSLFFWAEPDIPKKKPTEEGKWVRVRFVEVKP